MKKKINFEKFAQDMGAKKDLKKAIRERKKEEKKTTRELDAVERLRNAAPDLLLACIAAYPEASPKVKKIVMAAIKKVITKVDDFGVIT